MTASDWQKILKQLESKPHIKQRFLKFCKPKDRKYGIASKRCQSCGRFGAHISQYGLHFCRQCFRQIATELGFRKYQ